MLLEFDTSGAPEKFDLIRFIYKVLKLSIKMQTEQRDQELNTGEEMIEKTVDTEAKQAFNPLLTSER